VIIEHSSKNNTFRTCRIRDESLINPFNLIYNMTRLLLLTYILHVDHKSEY